MAQPEGAQPVSITEEPTIAAAGAAAAEPAGERARPGRLARRLLRHPVGLPAALFLVLVVLAVALAPVLAPASPLSQDFGHVLSGPTARHPLGSDQLGRDVLSRMLYGGRITLIGVAETTVVALAVGLLLGLVAGYVGGLADAVLSRAVEVVMAVPAIVVLLMVFSVFDNNEHWAMLALGFLSAPTIFRVTRGAALTVRNEAYLASARITGVRGPVIVLRHVLPRIRGPVIVNTAVLAALTLGIQGGLNFIGLGVTPPAPSWGGLVAEAQTSLQQQPWLIVPSGGITGLTILALVLLGDALRDLAGEHGGGSGRGAGTAVAQPEAPSSGLPAAPAGPAPLLSVRDLSVVFPAPGGGTVRVVQDVGFDVMPGEALGIVGESSCGKSVTSMAVLGLLRGASAVSGSAHFQGRDLFTLGERERAALRGRQIGFVSQEPMRSLDPNYTVGRQLAELVAVHDRGLSRAGRRQRVLELLGQVGLPDPAEVAGRYPHQISGGMAQRVSIAAALAGRPALLVADEPTTALDVTVQADILGLLRRLRDETGMSIVIITHDLGVVADLCDRTVVMYAGEVVEVAGVTDLMHAPSHPYTKALLASNPVFAVAGRPLPAIPGTVPAPAAWPAGCHFADRCPYRTTECTRQPITLRQPRDRQLSRCLHSDRLLAEAER
jgi:peptide/nickel transport system permease protein